MLSTSSYCNLTLEDLPNIKSVSINRLKRIGIESVLELATSIPQEIANESGENLDTATALKKIRKLTQRMTATSKIIIMTKSHDNTNTNSEDVLTCSTDAANENGVVSGLRGVDNNSSKELSVSSVGNNESTSVSIVFSKFVKYSTCK
jgi:hypothetical protein